MLGVRFKELDLVIDSLPTVLRSFRAMKPAFIVSAIITVASFLAVCPDARPFGPDPEPVKKIAHLRNEIIALDASLITVISQAENSISEDLETLHACIIGEHAETIDTRAAYREAKSLIHDLDVLRQHAIADLRLPSGFTPPEVVLEPSPGPMTELRPALTATYQDIATAIRLVVTDIYVKALDLEQKLEKLVREENIRARHMFQLETMLNQFSQESEAVTSIMSASNSAIIAMARNESI